MKPIWPLFTWVVVLAEFFLNLGGLHPSDARRDMNLLVGAIALVALQVPIVLRWARQVREGGRAALPRREVAWTAVRLAFAAYVFWFIYTVR